MAGAGGTPPLRLKDLLELDCDSCSAAGFRCYPRRLAESAPMRHLLESSPSLRRRPGKLSHLSRSLSRRLSRGGGGFWRRRDVEEEEDDAAAVPVAATAVPTGCGSSSEEQETSSSESSDNSSERTGRRSRSESDSDFSSATEESAHHPSQAAAAAGDEHEVAMKSASKEGRSSSGSEAGDREQLSPVAVMDFPFDDEEDESRERDAGVACSPSFSLARLQRRKTHKIRRFGSGDELAPMDLEALLATTSDSDPDRPADEQMIQCRTEGAAATPTCASRGHGHRRVASVLDVPDEDDDLISLLMRTVSAGLDGVSERLLLDFFVETKRRRSEARAESGPAAGLLRRKAERLLVDGEAVAVARGWLEGTATQRWGLKDVLGGGADIVAEMGRGRRWMQVGEEEREVVALVTGMMVDQLVGEVVRCLVV